MLDLVYLLGRGRALRWQRIFEWLDGSLASTYVYVLLSYLSDHRLIALAPDVLRELFVRQRSFGRANLKVLHALLDRYVTEGLRHPLEGSPVAELTLGQRAPRSLEPATVASVA